MKFILLGMLAAAVFFSTFTLTSAQPWGAERIQHWAAHRETMFHAKLAGLMKARAVRPLYGRLDDSQKQNFELFEHERAMSEPRPPSDPPSVEWDYRGGRAGYSWEPYGWAE